MRLDPGTVLTLLMILADITLFLPSLVAQSTPGRLVAVNQGECYRRGRGCG